MAVDPSEVEARRRAAARAGWPIARFSLGDESSEDPSGVTTPVERVAMMWPLAESAWKVAGRAWPAYDRQHMPARLFRAGTARPADDDA